MLDEVVDMVVVYFFYCNFSFLVEVWKGKGIYYIEYYGLFINQ